MDVYVLDSSFVPVAVIDCYQSLIWTKRYYTCGDFELYIPADDSLLPYLKEDNFIARDDDDSVMIIEAVNIQTDAENGDFFIVSGRSLESVLSRRVVMTQTVVNAADVVQGIKQLIVSQTGNGNPSSYRAFPNLVIDDSLEVPENLLTQFTGTVLLDAVSQICKRFGIGFKMAVTRSQNSFQITLSFYEGSEVDVTFSPEFDNLINSKYVCDYSTFANYAIVAGEGEGVNRITMNVPRSTPTPSGFSLREMFVDARDMSSNNGGISSGDYMKMLSERGMEKLAERDVTQSFEAEIEPQMTYKYKSDYNLGDIVTVTNEYGVTAKPRIIEIIESWDETGYTVVPTFDALEVAGKIILRDSAGFVLRDSTGAIITVKG